jgi:hypothetical protein
MKNNKLTSLHRNIKYEDTRAFSTNTYPIFPEKVYKNPNKEKLQILLENEGLTGVYF